MAEPAGNPDTKSRKAQLSTKSAYLILYNFASAIAWATVLGRTVALCSIRGPAFVYFAVGEWTKWTQTAAALELVHAVLGIVRTPILTTLMQISSRFLLVWLVIDPFPELARNPLYTSMLLAWSITEVIRYSYFALNISGFQPKPLVWLRYSTFFVLYPIGILSECGLIWTAIEPARRHNELYAYGLQAVLLIYIPGSYVLYTYMMKQRRKVMRSMKTKNENATK